MEIADTQIDSVAFDVPLLIRMFEYFLETKGIDDAALHKIVERIIETSKTKSSLTMEDYDSLIKMETKANKELYESIRKLESEIKAKDNPIQANSTNPRNIASTVASKKIPRDKDAEEAAEFEKGKLIKEIEKLERMVKEGGPGSGKQVGNTDWVSKNQEDETEDPGEESQYPRKW